MRRDCCTEDVRCSFGSQWFFIQQLNSTREVMKCDLRKITKPEYTPEDIRTDAICERHEKLKMTKFNMMLWITMLFIQQLNLTREVVKCDLRNISQHQ